MYLVGWLHFLTLEKWPSVGAVLCIPAVVSPLVTRAMCSGVLPSGPRGSFCCDRLTIVDGLVGVTGLWSSCLPGPALHGGCQGPQVVPGLVLADKWAEPGSRVGSCGAQDPQI